MNVGDLVLVTFPAFEEDGDHFEEQQFYMVVNGVKGKWVYALPDEEGGVNKDYCKVMLTSQELNEINFKQIKYIERENKPLEAESDDQLDGCVCHEINFRNCPVHSNYESE